MSRNGGLDWMLAPLPYRCNLGACNCTTNCVECGISQVTMSSYGQRIVVRGGDKIYFSTDAGASWAEARGLPTIQWRVVAASNDGQMVYTFPAVTCPKFTRYNNSWCGGCGTGTTSCDGCDAKGISCSLYGLYSSKDAGANWSLRRRDVPSYWTGLAVAAQQRVFAYGGADKSISIWVSNDSGATFAGHKPQPPSLRAWTYMTVKPEANLLAVGAYGDASRDALRISWDMGKSWLKPISLPLDTDVASNHTWPTTLNIASSSDGATLLLVNNNGYLYRSLDRASRWQKVTSVTPAKPDGMAPTQPAGWEWWSTAAVSGDGMIMYVAEVQRNELYKSQDRGATWKLLDTPIVRC